MTVPGVYTLQQARSGMADEKLVEAVAIAISGDHPSAWNLRPNDKAQLRALIRANVVLPGTVTRDDYRDDALAAIAAVRQYMQNDWK